MFTCVITVSQAMSQVCRQHMRTRLNTFCVVHSGAYPTQPPFPQGKCLSEQQPPKLSLASSALCTKKERKIQLFEAYKIVLAAYNDHEAKNLDCCTL